VSDELTVVLSCPSLISLDSRTSSICIRGQCTIHQQTVLSILTWGRNLGYILHPEVARRLPVDAKIADVGTGTGIFLQRLAQTYTSATLDGYDMSAALFPPRSNLPTNVNLSILDARQPPPQHLHGTYDLVHARLLVVGLTATDWAVVVQNLVKLLKPGGALQWEEGDFGGYRFYRGGKDEDESSVTTSRYMKDLFHDVMRPHFEPGCNLLQGCMKDAGLLSVQADCVSSDRVPETRKAMTKANMLVIFSLFKRMAGRKVSTTSPPYLDQLDEFERQVEAEIQSGCYVRFDIYSFRGFLPDSEAAGRSTLS
jgi:SAM-dependent methyltransferase